MKISFTIWAILTLMGCAGSPRAHKNAENIKKVKSGMRIGQVEKIMGVPDNIEIYPYNKEEYDFQYLSPSGSSDQFHIFIARKDSTVLRVGDGL